MDSHTIQDFGTACDQIGAAAGRRAAARRPGRAIAVAWLMFTVCAGAGWAQAAPQASRPAATPDQATAYYHFMLARHYQDEAEFSGRVDLFSQALEQYREALHADPGSPYLPVQLAGLLFRMGQTGDAIRLAQSVTREHPDNADAHELLGEVYVRLLGDGNDTHSQELLKLAIEQFQTLTRLRPNDADYHLALGRLYSHDAGQFDAAEAELQTARRLTKDAPEAVANLVFLYAEQGKLEAALQAFQSVPEEDRSASLYAVLASAYQRNHRFGDAAVAYQHASQLDPGNLDFHRGWAQNLYYNGALDQARQQYQYVAQNDPHDAGVRVRLAEIERRAGRLQAADADLAQARQIAPDSVEVAYFSADLFEAEGKQAAAAAALAELLKKSAHADGKYTPDEASQRALFLEKLGTLQRQAGNASAAVDAFQQMGTMGGDDAIRSYMEIAETYSQQHDYARAVTAAADGARQFPGDQGLAVNYALLLADTGQSTQGLALMRNRLKGQPADRPIYLAIAQVEERAKQWPEAEQAVAQANALTTSDAERALSEFVLGDIADRQRKYAAAETHLRRALQLDPHNPLTLNYLGYLLAERGEHLQEALGYVQQAVRVESDNGAYLDSLGWVFLKLKELPQAMANLQRAAQLQPNDPVVLGHLAQAYYLTGNLAMAAANWTKALEEWRTAAPADYDAEQVAHARKQLESVRVRLARMADKLPGPSQ